MTKRTVSFLVAAALTAGGADSAQGQFARRYAGVTAGATYSDITNYTSSLDWRWGATAGLVAGVVTFDYSFAELGPSWTQIGGGDIRLDYIDIPLLLGGFIPVGSDAALLRLYGGIALGLKVGCSAPSAAVCAAAKGSSWALPVGASFAKAVGNGRFVGVDGRYALGLSDPFEIADATSRSWQFRAFFGFPLGGI